MFQAINLFTGAYGSYDVGSLPLARVVHANSEVNWFVSLALAITLLPLLFPTGRPPTRRWRWAGWAAILGISAFLGGATVSIWYQNVDIATGEPSRDAPVALDLVALAGILLIVAGIIGSIVSMVVRFRRSRGIERLQLMWFVLATLVCLVAVFVLFFAPPPLDEEWMADVLGVGFLALPISIGIAVLRYRLYDIDRLINRALVYGSLSALLIGAYVLLVVALQALLEPLTSGSDLAVAGSTLVVAALFRPVRGRVQHTVDRRFYRRKYDAARTVDTFAARLRGEIDLDALTGELRGVVHETVQPAFVSLWLRPPQHSA
jgi:hypothetical protein